MVLSSADLAYMRGGAAQLLPDDVTVLDRVQARDASGGTTFTWQARPTPVKGRLAPTTDTDQTAFAGQLRGKPGYRLTVPHTTSVKEGDRLVLAGTTYTVLGWLGRGSWETARVLIVQAV